MCAAGGVGLLVLAGPAWGGIMLAPGTYEIRNHPDAAIDPPPYGLRLDELIDVTTGDDRFTFSFNPDDNPAINMQLTLSDLGGGNFSIRIFGTAYGGRDIGGAYDPAFEGLAQIDFLYTTATLVPGDDDYWVTGPTATNTGRIDFLDMNFPLFDKANDEGVTFRLGNEDLNSGHRGFDGISGWGWLNHGSPDVHYNASDWLFTVIVPGPGVAWLFVGAVIYGGRRRR
jgi:hypothetical protein